MIESQVIITQDFLAPVIDWIDREISETYRTGFTSAGDILLEVRHHFYSSQSPNVLVGGFYQYLEELEKRHYLLGYRIRHWFSLHFMMRLEDPLERVPARVGPLYLSVKCLGTEKKRYFEQSHYAVPYHDVRVRISRSSDSA